MVLHKVFDWKSKMAEKKRPMCMWSAYFSINFDKKKILLFVIKFPLCNMPNVMSFFFLVHRFEVRGGQSILICLIGKKLSWDLMQKWLDLKKTKLYWIQHIWIARRVIQTLLRLLILIFINFEQNNNEHFILKNDHVDQYVLQGCVNFHVITKTTLEK